jgi:hypothetical protein
MYIERYILRSNLAGGPLNKVVMLIVLYTFHHSSTRKQLLTMLSAPKKDKDYYLARFT